MDQPLRRSIAAAPSDDIRVTCYDGKIPSFVESELERLYGHIYSSLAFFRLFKSLDNVRTYVASRGGRTTALLLFRCENGTAEVYNEMVHIEEQELCRFTRYLFEQFPSISVICFEAIRAAPRRLPYPAQQYNDKEEFVISLPGAPDEYLASMGKSTRSNIKRYSKRLEQRFPSFTHETYENEDVDEQHVREIIRMSKDRMTGKKKKFSVDDAMMEGLVRLAKTRGFVNVVMIDGRLCAGSISYRIGSRYFAFVNAHDAEFDEYWLGTLCYYLTIRAGIIHGGTRLHMGWGRYEYKSRLLGVREDFDRLVVYRSGLHMLLRADRVAKTAVRGYVRRLKLWLQDPQRRNSVVSRGAVNAVYMVRKVWGR
jgi:hypothetical protein